QSRPAAAGVGLRPPEAGLRGGGSPGAAGGGRAGAAGGRRGPVALRPARRAGLGRDQRGDVAATSGSSVTKPAPKARVGVQAPGWTLPASTRSAISTAESAVKR